MFKIEARNPFCIKSHNNSESIYRIRTRVIKSMIFTLSSIFFEWYGLPFYYYSKKEKKNRK